MWDLCSVIRGHSESSLSPSYKDGILHTKHLTKYKSVLNTYHTCFGLFLLKTPRNVYFTTNNQRFASLLFGQANISF